MQECGFEEAEGRRRDLALDELKQDIKRHRPDLVMNRVPEEELRVFKEMSNIEFNGDYGITLKFLINYFINDLKFVELHERVAYLEGFVEKLSKSVIRSDSAKDIKMCDGSSISTNGD